MITPDALALPVAPALGGLALIMIGPGPVWVARWRFLYRVPRSAVLLWQAGTVAALGSLIGAGALAGTWAWAAAHTGGTAAGAIALGALVAAFTVSVAARLAWSTVAVARSTWSRRRRHRAAVDVLGRIERDPLVAGLRVVTERRAVAYCLPAARDSRVVLSSGTLALLSKAELAAVLAHESAHIRARHDLVLDAFTALHRAFPVAVRSELPERHCRLLVELLADDAARRRAGSVPLARALVALAGSPVPSTALGAHSAGGQIRVERLLGTAAGYSRRLAVGIYALAAALLLGPLALLSVPWLTA